MPDGRLLAAFGGIALCWLLAVAVLWWWSRDEPPAPSTPAQRIARLRQARRELEADAMRRRRRP